MLDCNPTTFNRHNINMLQLLRRSPDRGDGWRSVSDLLWPHTIEHLPPELIEKDEERKRVRLSERGKIIMDYIK